MIPETIIKPDVLAQSLLIPLLVCPTTQAPLTTAQEKSFSAYIFPEEEVSLQTEHNGNLTKQDGSNKV